MIKKLLLFSVFLLCLSNSFSAAIYGYNNSNGYVFLLNTNPASGINVTLTCTSTVNTFNHYTLTNSQGYYSFAGVTDSYNSSASTATCVATSSKRGVANTNPNSFVMDIHEGDVGYFRGIEVNFSYNNVGTASFDFSGLTGYLKSFDQELVKNQSITLNCPNNQLSLITNSDGFYDFPATAWSYSCDPLRSDGCDILCNVSNSNQYNSFFINPQGYVLGQTVIVTDQRNVTYPFNVKVNGLFSPANGSYGNMTNFVYNASNYAPGIYSCKYSSNIIRPFSQMTDFNSTIGKAFIANISLPFSGVYNYFVLCNTSLATENIPRMVSYNINLGESNITINSPNSSLLFTTNSNFNITLDQPASYCTFQVNLDAYRPMTNISLLNYYANQTGLTEGLNNVTFLCRSYYGVFSSKSITFLADVTPPAKVDSLSAKLTNLGNVVLIWTPVVNASRYYVYRGQSSAAGLIFSPIQNISEPIIYTEDLNAVHYQTYYYRVSAVDEAGNEGDSAYSSSITVISENDYKDEIVDLSVQLNRIKNQTLVLENQLKQRSEIVAKIVTVNADLAFFDKFKDLMIFSELETMHNIRSFLIGYENMTLDELKSTEYQMNYNLGTYFKNYKKTSNIKLLNTAIDSLNISFKITELILDVAGKKYYYYEINATLFNPLNGVILKNIDLSMPLSEKAIMGGVEYINSSYNYSLNSLDPLANQSFSYSFNTLTAFNNTNISALMTEKIMPKPLTAYNVLMEANNNLWATVIIWFITLALSISLLFQYKNYHATFKN